ncbi:MAG: hypothetical protein FWE35_28695 [Streptosporangiales bacterium]|nr:hypothetical protein [Streptosporangiales bacterium]
MRDDPRVRAAYLGQDSSSAPGTAGGPANEEVTS